MSSPSNPAIRLMHQHKINDNCIHIDKTSFDECERQILQITRFFFLAFHHPETHAWMSAYKTSEQNFNTPYGATIANAVQIALNILCGTRGAGLNYHDPKCETCIKYITLHEHCFIETLYFIRKLNKFGAKENAIILCEGMAENKFLDAMNKLATIIEEYHTHKIKIPIHDNINTKRMH